ncbi:MAG TPA: hypothetical protein VJT80_22965 [Steroidobacteraceae bacterium]|nr:hypothetical protein [Steroidobacteraceae bacterium]
MVLSIGVARAAAIVLAVFATICMPILATVFSTILAAIFAARGFIGLTSRRGGGEQGAGNEHRSPQL